MQKNPVKTLAISIEVYRDINYHMVTIEPSGLSY